jgi:hypothetical protein
MASRAASQAATNASPSRSGTSNSVAIDIAVATALLGMHGKEKRSWPRRSQSHGWPACLSSADRAAAGDRLVDVRGIAAVEDRAGA